MYATVANIQEDVVTLQIADGVRARFNRSAVQSVIDEDSSADDKKGG
jgi:preprotein translocase subunit YajC